MAVTARSTPPGMDWLEHEEAPLDEPMLPPLPPPRSPRRKASVVRESFNINEMRDDYVRASVSYTHLTLPTTPYV